MNKEVSKLYTYTDEMYHAAMNILDVRADQLAYEDGDELYHHGILGMKWGVRRYQNEDGSLTPEGERRYAKLSDRERLTKIDATERGANAGRFGAMGAGFATGELLAQERKRKKMSDEEFARNIEESFAANKKNNRFGDTMVGVNYGSGLGMMLGGLAGLGISQLTGNESECLAGGIIAGTLLGSAVGGITLNKTADARFDKRHQKYLDDPNMAYRKRTRKELAEYDREHGIDNTHTHDAKSKSSADTYKNNRYDMAGEVYKALGNSKQWKQAQNKNDDSYYQVALSEAKKVANKYGLSEGYAEALAEDAVDMMYA